MGHACLFSAPVREFVFMIKNFLFFGFHNHLFALYLEIKNTSAGSGCKTEENQELKSRKELLNSNCGK